MTSADTEFASADTQPAGSSLPPWAIPALVLLVTSMLAVGGAIISPRLRGQVEAVDHHDD